MKRIIMILCTLALVIARSVSVTVDATTDASYSPIYVETYNYGDFDELGMNKIYQLSPSDDPRLIPTEDFEHNGRRYFLLDLIREDEECVVSENGCGTVTYTAVFGSEKLPGKAKSSSCMSATTNPEVYADPLGLKSMLVVAIVMLALAFNAMLKSRKLSHHPTAGENKDKM